MTPEEFLTERKRIHAAATEGPWKQNDDDGLTAEIFTDADAEEFEDRWERQDTDIHCLTTADATAIVEAHNTLPKLVEALEKVLELHQPISSGIDGSLICEKCSVSIPVDESLLAERESVYPCDTVAAITAALGGDDGE